MKGYFFRARAGEGRIAAIMLTVLLIHGVNADTSWQDRIAFVLHPHFATAKITYPQYQTAHTVPILALEGILQRVALPIGVNPATLNGYRMQAMRCVAEQMGQSMSGGAPHIIAHSFGTYLTAIVFERYDWPRANRIIFCGSAVAEDFPWERARRDVPLGSGKFKELRNDWFPCDQVIKLADWVPQIPHLGCAGVRGFTVVPGLVHNVTGAALPCSNWRRGECVPIHNVKREIAVDAEPAVVDHSLAYLTPASVTRFWLPYLWGLDAVEHEDLRELSHGTDEAQRVRDSATIRNKVDKLLGRKYSWWQKPMLEHISEVLNSDDYKHRWKDKTEVELQGRILPNFLARIERAEMGQADLSRNCENPGYIRDRSALNSLRDLHPHRALFSAIRQIVDGD